MEIENKVSQAVRAYSTDGDAAAFLNKVLGPALASRLTGPATRPRVRSTALSPEAQATLTRLKARGDPIAPYIEDVFAGRIVR